MSGPNTDLCDDRVLVIRGGRVIDPGNGLDREADILIRDGRIEEIDKDIRVDQPVANQSPEGGSSFGPGLTTIDGRGHFVVPGLVDIHVHLREPGHEHKEDIVSGTRAAAAGGFTSVCCMPNTLPTNDNRAVTELLVRTAREAGFARVFPIGAISQGLSGERLAEYAEMKRAGAVAFSDDGRCVMDAGLMRRAMEYAATFSMPVLQHCEDICLSAHGAMHEGIVSTRTGLSSQPAQAESVIVARDIELCELTGARYHGLHLSTASSLRHIRQAKERGLPVTCEVAPHHFTLSDEACLDYDSNAKVNPPLRSAEHVDAVNEAIADGTVDAIATDHAPHASVDKDVEFGCAAFGISGLETALPLCLNLWRNGIVSLNRVVELLTSGPAAVLQLPAGVGSLAVGSAADITIIDPESRWTVEPSLFLSKGKNTPFAGREMRGSVSHTLLGGRSVYDRKRSRSAAYASSKKNQFSESDQG